MPSKLSSMVITTAEGEAKAVKGWIREFGTLHPLTLAIAALVAGNLLGVFLHI